MLFGRAVIGSSILIASAAVATFLLHVRTRPYDASRYRKLVQESAELRSRRALERHPAHQMRAGVQKDIWAVDGTERLHFRLNSGYSELSITQKKDKFEAVEELQQINCWIQEKIDPNTQMQQVRTLTASEGTYYYPSHRFLANAVHLGIYRLPGIELPTSLTEKPFLIGVARQATFVASGKNPTFTAYDITATLDPESP
jgi:hypothetical protein